MPTLSIDLFVASAISHVIVSLHRETIVLVQYESGIYWLTGYMRVHCQVLICKVVDT